MNDITLWEFMAVFLITMGAGFIQSSIGFGFSIVALPFLVMLLPLKQAVPILAIVGFFCYGRVVYILREHIEFKIVLIPLLASIVGRTVGTKFLIDVSGSQSEYLKILLGLSFIIISIYFAFYKSKISVEYNVKNGLIFGFISGLFAGVFNIGGPPVVLYYMAGNMAKEKYMVTLQLYFTLSTVFGVILHVLYGNVFVSTLGFSVLGLLGVIAGGIVGSKVFNKLNIKAFNNAVYTFLALSGVYTIIKSVTVLV